MRFAALLLLAVLAACSKKEGGPLPDVRLPTLAGGDGPSLASCPAPRCVTVYVAPWCGVCRASTPTIQKLEAVLKSRGAELRVVVGLDRLENVRDYARDFGPRTLLDPDNAVAVAGGVPRFYVTDAAGRLLKIVPGMPRISDAAPLADYLLAAPE